MDHSKILFPWVIFMKNYRDLTQIELLSMTFLLAFCSIIYELLLANTLGIMTGSYIFWQSITIGVYIGGLGVGASLAGRPKKPFESLFRVEWVLSVLGMLCVLLLYFFHGAYRSTDFLFYIQNEYFSPAYIQQSAFLKFLFTLGVQGLTFLIGLFSGYEIPLLMKAIEQKSGKEDDESILGLNYIGTLFGSLFFAFIFLPVFDVLVTSLIVGGLNLLICLYLMIRRVVSITPLKFVSLSVSVIILMSIGLNTKVIEQTYLKTYYMFKRYVSNPNRLPLQFFNDLGRFKDVERTKSKYQYIDVYQPELLNDELILAIDTNFQFSTYNERFYHEAFAHVPINMTGVIPKRVLVLGGGDGLLKRELLKYDEIEEIVHVELDETIIEFAKTHPRFLEMNEDSLNHPKVKTIIADAFYFLRTNDQQFDAVYIDFPYPNSYNLARLYSVEFYRFVKSSVNDNGFVIFDAPIHNRVTQVPSHMQGTVTIESMFQESDQLSNSILLSTASTAGFSQLFPFKVGEESFLLMANLDRQFHYDIDKRDLSRYTVIEPMHLREIMRQEFPHRIAPEYVNSIFRPRLLRVVNK
jgi:spermidine synthase